MNVFSADEQIRSNSFKSCQKDSVRYIWVRADMKEELTAI